MATRTSVAKKEDAARSTIVFEKEGRPRFLTSGKNRCRSQRKGRRSTVLLATIG